MFFFIGLTTDKEREIIKNKFDIILKKIKTLANKEIESDLIKIGVKYFQTRIKHNMTDLFYNSHRR